MRNNRLILFTLLASGWSVTSSLQAQTTSNNITVVAVTDRDVPFRLSDEGVTRPVEWGLDTAWPDEANMRRGVAFMGAENVDVVRVSFRPTHPLVDGDLQAEQKQYIKDRLELVKWSGDDTRLTINCDHPSVDSWYQGNAERWAQLMDVTTKYFQDGGREVVSIAPFNEPDYGWGQGTIDDFYNIAGELRKNSRFDNIRICGGNTLNCDQALPWYNKLKDRLDEGNTHQLAGSFDNFAKFFETVRADGKHATADEMHNVMEAMVGLEYGLQTGIWWGTAEYARGEFCKASHGARIGYAEHRPNWTAASVYRSPDGKVQAFGGTSERQAVTTTYRFISTEKDVFYNGYGPQREYYMELPGGVSGSYQDGQTNAECVVNVTWGEDIQPVIDGDYYLVNRSGNTLLTQDEGNLTSVRFSLSNRENQQWSVKPVSTRVGGDFSYFHITSLKSGQALDVLNWSLEDGADVISYAHDPTSANQQWYLEYAEDGWFTIRHRHSSLCLEYTGGNVQQGVLDGEKNQQWRFVSIESAPRIRQLSAPLNLSAQAHAASVSLTWDEHENANAGYTVLRADKQGGPYNTIARNVSETSFTDHKTEAGQTYYYVIKATDLSRNTSPASEEVSATPTGAKGQIVHYSFEENLLDTTVNRNHCATLDTEVFNEGKVGNSALSLDGSTNFAQLPTHIANHNQITIATWVKWNEGNNWQRVFDFGNGTDQYMFLTPRTDTRRVRFAIKNGGDEQCLETSYSYSLFHDKWVHLAVTLGEDNACLYVNGELADSSTDITIRPSDFKPFLNYIGRSQFNADPMFSGSIDDFRIYNYAFSADEIKKLFDDTADGIATPKNAETGLVLSPLPANDKLYISYSSPWENPEAACHIYNAQGKQVWSRTVPTQGTQTIDVSGLASGLYLIRITDGTNTYTRKFIIKH